MNKVLSPKIFQVSAYYPPHLGGQENAVHDLATQLAAEKYNVEVLTSDIGYKSGIKVEDDVLVSRLKSNEFAHTALMWGLFTKLLQKVKHNDVVHVHVGQAFTPEMVWLASKVKGFNYVLQMHIEPIKSGSVGFFLPFYKRFLLAHAIRGATCVLVLNEEHKKIIKSDYSYKGEVIVISNGVNNTYFSIKHTRKLRKQQPLNLLFVGRLSPQKNLGLLLKAMSNLNQKANLKIIGNGESLSEVQNLISLMKLSNVKLIGEIDRYKLLDFYAEADALILPSMYEAQPLVLLEAMAVQLPILGANVRGIKEHISKNGILFEPTISGIQESIMKFSLMTDAQINTMTAIGFKSATESKWGNLIDKYLLVYKKLAK